jgi:hypothetical protein
MTFEEFDKELQAMEPELKQSMKKAALLVGNTAANDFTSHFDQQGFNGKPWAEVERRKAVVFNKSGEVSKKQPSSVLKAILIGTGRLKRAVQDAFKGIQVRENVVVVKMQVNSDYGIFHNEGTIQDGGHLPKRQFAGDSPALEKKITKILNDNIKLTK